MAKSTIKKVSSSSSWNQGLTMPVPVSKKEKVNGKRYSIEEDHSSIEKGSVLGLLKKDTILVECDDKMYQPYINGSKLFFRIGNTIIGKLKLREIVL